MASLDSQSRYLCWFTSFPRSTAHHRWLRIGRIGVQPSEFAKVAFVLALGRYLMHRENYRRFRGLMAPLALATVPVLLILKEPDLGTAAVFLPVLLAMLLVAGSGGPTCSASSWPASCSCRCSGRR